jgi:uncharacterized iron-regulated membrane protein
MSNVLIGIIGVILFIGLALAGALFLGPRFQEATTNSKAAAISQATAQMSRGAELYRLNEGVPFPAGAPTVLVEKGYLKSIPENPLGNWNFFDFRAANGSYTGNAAYALAGMDAANPTHLAVCRAINKQAGIATAANGTPPVAAAPIGQQGCFIITNDWGELPNGLMIVYHAV